MSRVFRLYGSFCATHPWEVIVAVVTLTTCLLTVDQKKEPPAQPCPGCFEEQFKAVDVIVMTVIRCLAILYSSHQFRNLQKLGSKYILGLAGLFIVFSSFVFTSTVLNFLQIDLVDLKDALFFFLLLIDLSKAATLAQFALTASSQEEISSKIARGMSVLGPTITLDTVVETLVIGVGTLSGVHRLEMLSYFACLSVLVNYVIFMTFYPACLSLMLELARISNFYGEKQPIVSKMLLEENEKANPAVQRVKLIMSIGLTAVHVHSRWFVKDESTDSEIITNTDHQNCAEDSVYGYLMKQFALSADHIVILILVVTLIIKFIFFENDDHLKQAIDDEPPHVLKRQKCITKAESINEEKEVQTNDEEIESLDETNTRNLEECLQIYRSDGASKLSDKEVILLIDTKHLPAYNLEKAVKNQERGVKIRRQLIQSLAKCESAFLNLPYKHYDYSKVMGACCENVIGYIPVPLGVAGPLVLDGKQYYIPMSTTEGCLIASANRGCRAVEHCGIKSRIVSDGMTRGPVVRFNSITKASEVTLWLEKPENFLKVKENFDSTSRFARLSRITSRVAGRYLFLRFVAETGDAMGMNMLSKGTEKALFFVQRFFPEMEILSLSGNYCADKKPAAVNWVEGRGKSVVCEAIVSGDVVSSVLKSSTQVLVDLNTSKNMIGSAMAGSIGGFNAHAANIVTAIFIATGQDPAQNIASSNCITIMEPWGDNGQDLYVSCTMPSIEIGTIGGGTILPAQSACLDMLGVRGPNEESPGANSKQLARIVCATVLAGELSLMAALATGQLVKSHLKYNRSYSEKDSQDCCKT
ncbi:3-hydroxy-3-methylglutaryl-coenzyme A reductase [Tribolium castaneum]|uniref:3-hydroxy-3-methylglutaryl coenzyme A reductase n=1 Tax=Tribolium castaneum TaxID=7070 RepID=D6WSF8_TRICA|nr:PREDICTED: 3-hydroxy-3-methylglutaryl-coenzyme A reductase [Tribolium castaneum]EFA06636.1 3-hydroxy-3-methylglutaryl-coenzyme A reductase-like Protein [Tribolium castaneum]|eukprot:XP_973160.1 PREDICTED: 3-hydroxy-3-methylglutaryl-coenzyme A reductase [Tribolium castaneum]